jgi:uncharacterized protein YbjQ (UPF0145 family)
MIVVTTEDVVGHRIVETKGQVFGLVVRSRGLGGNVMASLRSLGGGEITEYTELLEEARRHAIDRMVGNATAMGGNAIVRMMFDSSEIGQTMSEIVAYGTAVVLEPEKCGASVLERGLPAGAVAGLAVGVAHGLQLRVHAQLLEDALHVASRGGEPYAERSRDALVVQAAPDQLENLSFASCELVDLVAVAVALLERLALDRTV